MRLININEMLINHSVLLIVSTDSPVLVNFITSIKI